MSEVVEKSKKADDIKKVFYEKFNPADYEGYEDEEDTFYLPEIDADFNCWGKMPYWSLEESVSLLLGQDPEVVYWDIARYHQKDPFTSELSLNYAKLRNIVLRAFEMQEIGDPNSPVAFLEWADSRGIEIPEALRQQVAPRKILNLAIDTETENLLKIKDEEIAALQKRIEVLEALVWEGFDENASTYSNELAIAVRAHGAVSKNWKSNMSIKQQITIWLQENHPKLSKEEKERIAKMCNWQKAGGAPSYQPASC